MASSSKTEKSDSNIPREDQVINAMNFLVHPKVKDSAESSKRDFLEKKGLTEEEINEAFARVQRNGGIPGSHAVQPSSQPHSKPWAKVLGGVGVLAASAYLIHKYALPWVSEWRKKKDATPHPNERPSAGVESDQLILSQSLKSMEVLLVELNSGLHGLSSRIDRLALGDKPETFRQDIAEIKSLIKGSRWEQLSQSARESESMGMNGDIPLDASEPRKGFVSESGLESSSEMHTYMHALGLSSTQPEPNTQVDEGTKSTGGLAEIEASIGDEKPGTMSSEETKQANILVSARAWQPPPLPQPIFPAASKLES